MMSMVNHYFYCTIVSLDLCKEYLNVTTCETSVSTPDKELSILMCRMPFFVIMYRSCKLLKMLFGSLCIDVVYCFSLEIFQCLTIVKVTLNCVSLCMWILNLVVKAALDKPSQRSVAVARPDGPSVRPL